MITSRLSHHSIECALERSLTAFDIASLWNVMSSEDVHVKLIRELFEPSIDEF